MEQILDVARRLDGVLELAPAVGSEYPEIAWGDHFFYYAPDGQLPEREQPYATIVTKNYPDDTLSDLDPPGRWRLNLHIGRSASTRLLSAGGDRAGLDPSTEDRVLPHPLYAAQGWVSIVNPGAGTTATAIELLRGAHEDARRRAERRDA